MSYILPTSNTPPREQGEIWFYLFILFRLKTIFSQSIISINDQFVSVNAPNLMVVSAN